MRGAIFAMMQQKNRLEELILNKEVKLKPLSRTSLLLKFKIRGKIKEYQ